MNTKMHGKKIKSVWWPDTEIDKGRHIIAEKEVTLDLSASYHGDHDEFWVIEYLNGVEIARHNPRYIESIIWD